MIVGILFGLAHTGSANPEYLVPLGFLGFVLCLVRWRTRSIYPGMALHSANNSLALAVQLHWSLGAACATDRRVVAGDRGDRGTAGRPPPRARLNGSSPQSSRLRLFGANEPRGMRPGPTKRTSGPALAAACEIVMPRRPGSRTHPGEASTVVGFTAGEASWVLAGASHAGSRPHRRRPPRPPGSPRAAPLGRPPGGPHVGLARPGEDPQ